MSADNYIFVSKNNEGKYVVSMRFASTFYRDECSTPPMEGYGFTVTIKGWTIEGDSANEGRVFESQEEAEAAATRRPDWIVDPPTGRTFDNPIEAILYAHKWYEDEMIVEYGVSIHPDVLKDAA